MNLDNPIESVAAALHAACLRDFSEIQYKDRDWGAHRAYMDGLSKDERSERYRQEKETGTALGPTIDKSRRPTTHDCEVIMFPQMWGSTALGYGGIGGQAMTPAYTTVVTCNKIGYAAVYFGAGGRLAYLVPEYRQKEDFMESLRAHRMVSCKEAVSKYSIECREGEENR